MQYRRLGRSGLRVSTFSLGSWVTYHNQVDTGQADEMMDAAFDAGINFFDNAEVYAGGRSEAIMGEALKSAKIEIVGGESQFFDKITQAIGNGRAVDRLVANSQVLSDVKETFFNGDPDYFKGQLRGLVDQFGVSTEDIKNVTVAALLGKMMGLGPDSATLGKLQSLVGAASRFSLADQPAAAVLGAKKK